MVGAGSLEVRYRHWAIIVHVLCAHYVMREADVCLPALLVGGYVVCPSHLGGLEEEVGRASARRHHPTNRRLHRQDSHSTTTPVVSTRHHPATVLQTLPALSLSPATVLHTLPALSLSPR